MFACEHAQRATRFCSSFLSSVAGGRRKLSEVGRVGFAGVVRRMDAAAKPYLIGIWQRRCREPAWAAV
ncbi:hypothetical protein BN126360411 [Stenotrophomonas indicatrix]|nr:hypothetical protein BN126360411 [Stenotrophomonas indicatrix]